MSVLPEAQARLTTHRLRFIKCFLIFRLTYHIYFLYKLIYFILFIYFWLHWVFVAAHGLSLVAASRGYSSLQVRVLLSVVASLAAEQGLQARGLQ